MVTEQEQLANETKAFLVRWGLKAKYVASVCVISQKVFSQFMNHKLALSQNQLNRLMAFISDYERRNS